MPYKVGMGLLSLAVWTKDGKVSRFSGSDTILELIHGFSVLLKIVLQNWPDLTELKPVLWNRNQFEWLYSYDGSEPSLNLIQIFQITCVLFPIL